MEEIEPMRGTFWRRAKRQWRRALVRVWRAAAPAQSPEAILYVEPYHFCEQLHVPGCKFLSTQENVTPDFELFDLTHTTAPNDSRNQHTDHIGFPIPPVADAAKILREKTKFCAFVVSNPFCATRNRFLEILSRSMRVEAGGRTMRSVRYALGPRNVPDYPVGAAAFYPPYKFVITFENSLALDYASEKVWTAIHAKAVPIYWGNPHMVNYFNPERFINAFDFDTLESLARHVMRVHADDDLYLRYLSAPSGTPRQKLKRWKKPPNQRNLRALNRKFRRMRKTFVAFWEWSVEYASEGFFVSWVRLLTGRVLPLAQRRMFHRECLARFAQEACGRILESRLTMAGWGASRMFRTSRLHIWPDRAFYEDADMAGRLNGKD